MHRDGYSPPSRGVLLAIMAGIVFVFAVANFWIYFARFLFARDFPQMRETIIPTISGALSQPEIGDPFAIWRSMTALVLFVSVAGVIWTLARALPRASASLRGLFIAIVGMQAVACAGKVVLSHYTLPVYRDAHMAGSYMFFVAQTLTVILVLALSIMLARPGGPGDTAAARAALDPWANRLRIRAGYVIIAMMVTYLALFVGKDLVSEAVRPAVIVVYVNLESFCITAFLLYMASFLIDLHRNTQAARGL
ncbi:MAG: hypothetical protein AAF626_02310 [Pseudomonadota bacterium]